MPTPPSTPLPAPPSDARRLLAGRASLALGSFLAGFTLIELENQFHPASAGFAGALTGELAFEPLAQHEIDLERELDSLELP